jgi:hypothetical protein
MEILSFNTDTRLKRAHQQIIGTEGILRLDQDSRFKEGSSDE